LRLGARGLVVIVFREERGLEAGRRLRADVERLLDVHVETKVVSYVAPMALEKALVQRDVDGVVEPGKVLAGRGQLEVETVDVRDLRLLVEREVDLGRAAGAFEIEVDLARATAR